jgi:glycosyltransferase involved in cell wall biosynthesis
MERVVQTYAEGLAARGHRVTVLAFARDGNYRQVERPRPGLEVHRFAPSVRLASGQWSLAYLRKVIELSRTADIVHTHEPNPLALAGLLLSGTRKPIHVTWHGDIKRQKLALPFVKPLQAMLCRRAATVQATSRGLTVSSYLLPDFADKISVIPLGLELGPYTAACQRTEEIVALRARYGGPFILAVGRLAFYKGYDILLRALQGTGLKTVIVGEGPLQGELLALRNELGLQDQVVFAGSVSDIELALHYAACRFFVLSSKTDGEAFGLVQIEAMACGKPVVNTQLATGVPEVSLSGVTGLTVPPADHEALRAAMLKLAGDPALVERLGNAARERAVNFYAQDIVLERLMKAYGL